MSAVEFENTISSRTSVPLAPLNNRMYLEPFVKAVAEEMQMRLNVSGIVRDEYGFIDWEASGIAQPNPYGEGRDTVPDDLLDEWTDLCDIAEQQWEEYDD